MADEAGSSRLLGRFFKHRAKNTPKWTRKDTKGKECIATCNEEKKDERVNTGNEKVEEDCTICLASVSHEKDDADDLVTLSCGHLFHRECVLQWYDINRTCPTCRKGLGGKEDFVRKRIEKRKKEQYEADLRVRAAKRERERQQEAARVQEAKNRARILEALYARPDTGSL